MSEHPWRKAYPADGRDFTKIEINMPREMRTWLEEMCGLLKLPPWRLICIALDNERDEAQPFLYPTDAPTTVFVPQAYNAAAHKIYEFLKKFRTGLGRDSLLLFRRQIGVANKTQLLLGLRELIEMRMALESKEFHKRNFMEYPPDYTVIRAANTPMASNRRIESEKKRLDQLETKLKRQRKKLELMEGNRDEMTTAEKRKQILESDKKDIKEFYNAPKKS